jgi:serine O-acetyltransferase
MEYTPRTLERIRRNNEILKRCYSIFIDKIACHVIDIPIEKTISQTPERRGFNPTDLDETLHSRIARGVAAVLDLDGVAIPPLRERVENLFNLFGSMLDAGDVPSIHELHTSGLRYLREGDLKHARWCERLIMLLRNSSVPLTVEMGKVMFGYGGIGVVVHAQCKLGDYVNIGTNVTLGGGKQKVDSNGISRNFPNVEERVYIATGAKLIGGITIGHHSIVGANAVVTTDVLPFSVVVGNPEKIINSITRDNLSRYASYLYKGMSLSEASRVMFGDTNAC